MIPGAAGSAADGALSRTSGASVDLGDDYVDAGARAHSRRTRVHCDGVSPSPLAPAPHCLQVHTPHKTSCDAGRNLEQSCLRGRRVGSLVFFCPKGGPRSQSGPSGSETLPSSWLEARSPGWLGVRETSCVAETSERRETKQHSGSCRTQGYNAGGPRGAGALKIWAPSSGATLLL